VEKNDLYTNTNFFLKGCRCVEPQLNINLQSTYLVKWLRVYSVQESGGGGRESKQWKGEERDFKMLCVDSMRGMKKITFSPYNEGSEKLHFSPYNI
jgi:hypothetical protein